MANRKLAKAVQQLFRQIWKLYRSLSKGFVTWLLRSALLPSRRRATAGFVLPTTVLLVLVVTLTSSALSYRALNNSSRVIGNVQSKQIYNAATPAVDRARAKVDYLFGKDPRLPGGVPAEEFIISMMLNKGSAQTVNGTFAPPLDIDLDGSKPGQPYDLQDETRVDLNGDGNDDNAWIYTDPSNGDSVIYAINLSTPEDPTLGAVKLIEMDELTKAQGDEGGPYVRRGPLSEAKAVNCPNAGVKTEKGWYEDSGNTAILRKRFQVDALVASAKNATPGNPAKLSTLEFSQDRQLDRGNKWGAWFQYDIEVHSGTRMNWNGALHSEGNIMLGNGTFNGFLISSPTSCVFLPESNSEISVREFDKQNDDTARKFFGVIAAGKINDNQYGGSAEIHRYRGRGYDVAGFNTGNDWATGSKTPIQLATNPVSLVLEGVQSARGGDSTNQDGRIGDPNTDDPIFFKRRFGAEDKDTRPYVDDTYRADNLYGPKVNYSSTKRIPPGTPAGTPIPASESELIFDPVAGTTREPGLDGYWERRTMANSDVSDDEYSGGMRILVGERLQLGNPFGWIAPQDRKDVTRQEPHLPAATGNGTWDDLRDANYATTTGAAGATAADPATSDNEGDPLNPPYKFTDTSRAHEARQRRALRDNLAAVQASAIYHYKVSDGKYPAACLISTSHPGTPLTLAESVNFTDLPAADAIKGPKGTLDTRFDFFYGKGTNGWEFAPPPEAAFSGGSPLRTALENLANFAGDPEGAFPPIQEAGEIHPDPTLTMFGNFSNLRKAMQEVGSGGYGGLSPAAKTYLHTAGCTISALAYNVSQIQKFDPSWDDPTQASDLQVLGEDIGKLIDGINEPATGNYEVLPKEQLATYGYDKNGTLAPDPSNPSDPNRRYNARDYDRVTPDMILATLKQKYFSDAALPPETADVELLDPPVYRKYRLATLIHEQFQIRRDRTYGFRPSPAANTWNFNPYVASLTIPFGVGVDPTPGFKGNLTYWSSACDPNVFKVDSFPVSPDPNAADINLVDSTTTSNRLFLSRLCGTVIPSGAVHDDPGDYNFPARGVPGGAFVPELTSADPNVTKPASGVDLANDPVQTAFRTEASLTGNSEKQKIALVTPKFPVLAYIFPEASHGQLETGAGDEYQQPRDSALFTNAPSALRPWTEPYVERTANMAGVADGSYSVVNPTALIKAADSEFYTTAISDIANKLSAATSFTYKAFSPFGDKPDTGVDLGAVPNSQYSPMEFNSWVLPNTVKSSIPIIVEPETQDFNNKPPNLIRYGNLGGSQLAAVPFLERVMFNGREWLPSRVLDIDLEMLRTSAIGNDYWLPVSGIVYAFREDARREDAIARPSNTLPLTLETSFTKAQTPDFPAVTSSDPALDPDATHNSLSIKAVDFIPDPDRRVDGFRLRRGERIDRPTGSVPDEKNVRGLTFVTDNLAYILGNFNRHQDGPGGNRLEEFEELLPNNPDDYNTGTFYDNRTTTDQTFARQDTDLWRPSEILADSITILSNNFCDGSVLDTFMNAGYPTSAAVGGLVNKRRSGSDATEKAYEVFGTAVTNGTSGAAVYNTQSKALFALGCQPVKNSDGATSFLNQNRPRADLIDSPRENWIRENPYDGINSPVKISRNGNGLVGAYDITAANPIPDRVNKFVPIEYSNPIVTTQAVPYFRVEDDGGEDRSRPLQRAVPTDVNAILISGIVPSRNQQAYGGLHNFPRLLEWWQGQPLRIQGSFLQLNFSNYGTAPYDQDSWEPSGNAIPTTGDEQIDYYGFAPLRLWGYDVGLQFAPASPAASRFTTPSSALNEFYDEPKVNDPYMKQMCTKLTSTLGLANVNCPG